MNTKKLFGLLVCVAVSAVAINAYANTNADWFGASAEETTLKLDFATTNGASITVSNSKITIDNDYDTLLAVAPKEKSPVRSDGLVTITSSAVLTPCAVKDLPTDFGEGKPQAQVGFAVATEDNSQYYYYTYGGLTPTWGNTGVVVTDIDQATTFTIVLDYRTKIATFKVDGNVVSNDVAFTGESLNDVAAFGSGSISSIGVGYEVAVAGYNNVKYGSVLEAVQAATAANANASAVVTYDDTGKIEVSASANGLTKAECAALGIKEDASVSLAPLAAANQTDNKNILLSTTVGAGYTVTFNVVNASSEVVSEDCPPNAIEIPRTAGTYTIVPTITATAE